MMLTNNLILVCMLFSAGLAGATSMEASRDSWIEFNERGCMLSIDGHRALDPRLRYRNDINVEWIKKYPIMKEIANLDPADPKFSGKFRDLFILTHGTTLDDLISLGGHKLTPIELACRISLALRDPSFRRCAPNIANCLRNGFFPFDIKLNKPKNSHVTYTSSGTKQWKHLIPLFCELLDGEKTFAQLYLKIQKATEKEQRICNGLYSLYGMPRNPAKQNIIHFYKGDRAENRKLFDGNVFDIILDEKNLLTTPQLEKDLLSDKQIIENVRMLDLDVASLKEFAEYLENTQFVYSRMEGSKRVRGETDSDLGPSLAKLVMQVAEEQEKIESDADPVALE